MTNEELAELVFEATDGLCTAIQLLVMSQVQTGHLDAAHYARLLADYRNTQCSDGGMQAEVLDRLLGFVAQEPEVLRRRLAMQLVPGDSPEAPPSPTAPGQPGE